MPRPLPQYVVAKSRKNEYLAWKGDAELFDWEF